ncbi:SsgA family sporulation/cell division regulator [Saccharopolyspora sp. K220]|uniref:SsgA family sporulation/cell division regulator n=1 Tax=Saccharopolyspora soli TaxID=2926618 RepID=UPI001F59A5AA|nr:SsgA family sporulation/cell division regulator [Saccharopolyspora soli]MCI2424332.1 SsgA family sporulation/cell division regulator [Saccharopolyspora soli]
MSSDMMHDRSAVVMLYDNPHCAGPARIATMTYRPSDPYAMELRFVDHGRTVTWTFHRDLLHPSRHVDGMDLDVEWTDHIVRITRRSAASVFVRADSISLNLFLDEVFSLISDDAAATAAARKLDTVLPRLLNER